MRTALIKQLREESGQGMMDCKRMLEEAQRELGISAAESEVLKKALELLQKNSSKKIEKKASRVALHGLVMAGSIDGYAYILEINCETDFVARNESFIAYSEKLSQIVLQNKPSNLDELLAAEFSSNIDIASACKDLIAKTGENIKISRFEPFSSNNGLVSYCHGQKLGVVVEYIGSSESAKDVALHIAANSPVALDIGSVPQDIISAERALYSEQAQATGKPAEVQEKMIDGKIKKFLSEVTLMDQAFVKDDDLKVSEYLVRTKTKIISFQRVALGEVSSSDA